MRIGDGMGPCACGLLAAALFIAPASAATRISLPAAQMSRSLELLAQQTGANILFSDAVVGNRNAPEVRGKMPAAEALARLLAGSGLIMEQIGPTTFVVHADPNGAPVPEPEILVVGKLSQNADIARSENDIQPYQVARAADIRASQARTVEDFLRGRVASDAQMGAPIQRPLNSNGSARTDINMRGLGSSETLVLLDGRRLPNVPSTTNFLQPDLGSVPVRTVGRIEVLGTTSGGIYGVGAMGGVVNVVLAHDFRGLEVSATSGVTERGDAPYRRIDLRFGLSLNQNRTHITGAYSRSHSSGLVDGQRPFALAARERWAVNDPPGFLASGPVGNGISFIGNEPLILLPQYGGTDIGSAVSFLPIGNNGIAASSAALLANAGRIAPGLSPDSQGYYRSLLTSTESEAFLGNIRQKLGGGVELFIDYLRLRNDGRASSAAADLQATTTSLYPGYPFASASIGITNVTWPLPEFGSWVSNRLLTTRQTVGAIIDLPGSWRATIDYGWGAARQRTRVSGTQLGVEGYLTLITATPPPGKPMLNPFGPWDAFTEALQAYAEPVGYYLDQTAHLDDANARVSGPLVELAGGKAMLTFTAEQRLDTLLPSARTSVGGVVTRIERKDQRVRSLYAEIRAPLGASGGTFPLFRGLEAQLAVRREAARARLFAPRGNEGDPRSANWTATLLTAGLKMQPLDALMLRGSYSSGEQLPNFNALDTIESTIFPALLRDPKRGMRVVGSEGAAQEMTGGSLRVRTERAETVSVGAVLTPGFDPWLRISLDWSHVRRRRLLDFAASRNDVFYLQNEDRYPGRVVRADLSEADRALGFIAGRVLLIDATTGNFGDATLDAFDLGIDQRLPNFARGNLHLWATASWQPNLKRQPDLEKPAYQTVDYIDGPLAWRAFGGADWAKGAFSANVTMQFYGGYRVTYSDPQLSGANALIVAAQGGNRVPAQLYVDLGLAYRVRAGSLLDGLDLRVGVRNLFDHQPPLIAGPYGARYSLYGDPRLRRFELSATTTF